jgi:hypothetical protein
MDSAAAEGENSRDKVQDVETAPVVSSWTATRR